MMSNFGARKAGTQGDAFIMCWPSKQLNTIFCSQSVQYWRLYLSLTRYLVIGCNAQFSTHCCLSYKPCLDQLICVNFYYVNSSNESLEPALKSCRNKNLLLPDLCIVVASIKVPSPRPNRVRAKMCMRYLTLGRRPLRMARSISGLLICSDRSWSEPSIRPSTAEKDQYCVLWTIAIHHNNYYEHNEMKDWFLRQN